MLFYHQGKPVAKQRHRMAGNIAYDPQSKIKNALKFEFAKQHRDQGYLNALQGAIRAKVDVCCQIPKSWSKKRQLESLGRYVITRPDLDNYEKFYFDVLNGIAYKDDSQIVSIFSQKRYSYIEGVEINLTQLGGIMINEHAITYKENVLVDDLNYLVKKANKLGLNNRQVVRVYQQEDEEGTHVYFEVDGLKDDKS